ncbi:hypothetical protein Tco_0416194, partial [Tanacetum coccineum]
RTMHAAVLTFERRLNWLEKNIDHCLKDAPSYEACELCHDDEMTENDDDLTKCFSKQARLDDFQPLF